MAYLQAKAHSYDVSRKQAEYNIDAAVNEIRALLDGPKAWKDTGLSSKGCCTTSFKSA